MSPIVSTIEIDRPPEEVFAYATDPTRFAEWQHDVVRAQLVDGGPAAGRPPPGEWRGARAPLEPAQGEGSVVPPPSRMSNRPLRTYVPYGDSATVVGARSGHGAVRNTWRADAQPSPDRHTCSASSP